AVSRIAEASAHAGCAVPDNPRVNWAKEREAAERLLSGTAAQPVIATPSETVGAAAPKVVRVPESEVPRVTTPEPVRVTAAEAARVTAPHGVNSQVVDAVVAPTSAPAAPPAVDSIEPPFSWPPAFNLDAIDLLNDPNARNFRRPRPQMQGRVEFDDQT